MNLPEIETQFLLPVILTGLNNIFDFSRLLNSDPSMFLKDIFAYFMFTAIHHTLYGIQYASLVCSSSITIQIFNES